jgi:hypothetical protein
MGSELACDGEYSSLRGAKRARLLLASLDRLIGSLDDARFEGNAVLILPIGLDGA